MEAKDLMIGDWVCIDEPDKYAGATGQIQSLMNHREDDAAYFNIFIQGKFGYVLRGVCSDDIRPIPLTPEILEKNGWEERPTGYVFYTNGKRYDNSLWYIFDSNTFVVNTAEFQIKYVHQLQHALRLCGIEKEIIL